MKIYQQLNSLCSGSQQLEGCPVDLPQPTDGEVCDGASACPGKADKFFTAGGTAHCQLEEGAGVTCRRVPATMTPGSRRAPQKRQQGWSSGHRVKIYAGCRCSSLMTSYLFYLLASFTHTYFKQGHGLLHTHIHSLLNNVLF